MGFNETCAYLHASISESGGNKFSLELNYDAHYCKYFEKNPSRWTLELSDNLRSKMQSVQVIYVDSKPTGAIAGASQVVLVPPGTGSHTIELMNK